MKILEKLSVIIPTLQKDTNMLNRLLHTLEKDKCVSEIIIIDNSRKGFNTNRTQTKVRVVMPPTDENLYVNQSWNLGVHEAKEEYFALFNDDVGVCKDFCTICMDKITNTKDFGCLGMNEHFVIQAPEFDVPASSWCYLEEDEDINVYFWGIIIFSKKSLWKDIPSNIKIWCGDNFIRYNCRNKNLKAYKLTNAQIYHFGSLSAGNPEFDDIKKQDCSYYAMIEPAFGELEVYKNCVNNCNQKVSTWYENLI